MNCRFLLRVLSALLAAIIFFNGGISPASADDQAKAAKGPVKIFLLSGQSNMTGRGTLGDLNKPAADQKATLVRFVKEPGNLEKYRFLYEGKQKTPSGWTVRDDVFITMGEWPPSEARPGGVQPLQQARRVGAVLRWQRQQGVRSRIGDRPCVGRLLR